MYVRIGTVDGLRYLSKHFQIVIFNNDTCWEEFPSSVSQVHMIQIYLQSNDLEVDAIYSSTSFF